MAATLRVELFPSDLDEAVAFYVAVLGFQVVGDARTSAAPYVSLQRGGVRLGLGQRPDVPDREQRRPPVGAELVLEVDDVTAERERVGSAGWPLVEDLTLRPWGLTDVRLLDPVGYYWRLTSRRSRSAVPTGATGAADPARDGAQRSGVQASVRDDLPVTLALATGAVELRRARGDDLPAVMRLLADDPLGRDRETVTSGEEDLEAYRRAFRAIDADPAHLLLVAVSRGEIVGSLQLSVLPGIARRGARRAQLEAVRVRRNSRGQGLGAAMVEWAIAAARRHGCALVQLTTDTSRADAHRSYERLGFTASHHGLELPL